MGLMDCKKKKTESTTRKKVKEHPIGWWRAKALEKAQRLAKFRESFGGATAEERYCVCISCGATVHLAGTTDRAEGGHYISRNCRATEMELDNIHPQCHKCNCYLSGNVVAYRLSLVQRIGESRVQRLENLYQASRGDTEALGKLDMKDQIEVLRKKSIPYYKAKCDELDKAIEEVVKSW